jgi:hypothetical protein
LPANTIRLAIASIGYFTLSVILPPRDVSAETTGGHPYKN